MGCELTQQLVVTQNNLFCIPEPVGERRLCQLEGGRGQAEVAGAAEPAVPPERQGALGHHHHHLIAGERGAVTSVQGSTKRWSPGLVNFVAALAYHFCLALHAAFTQPGDSFLAKHRI